MKRAFLVIMFSILMLLSFTSALAAPGDNLMANATIADCSGQVNDGERPELAIDGNLDHKWCCTMGNPKAPSITQYGKFLNWITFDLGEEKWFNRYDIAHASLCVVDFGTLAYNTKEWAVLVSNDLENWTEVSHITGNTEALTSHEIPLTCARYVRLVIIKGQQNDGKTARIAEFMLYESDENGVKAVTAETDAAIQAEVDAKQQLQDEADAKFLADIQTPARIYWSISGTALIAMLIFVHFVRKCYAGKPERTHTIIRSKWVRLIVSAGICILAASSLIENYDGTLGMFMFYTYLSNLFVVVVFAIQTVCCLIELTGQRARVPSVVKGWTTLAILFTFLTVIFVLSPFQLPASWLDCRIHYLVPLLAVAEWVLFEPHGKMRWYHPICWLFTPLMYFSYVLALSSNGIWFNGSDHTPYFFMDMEAYGWPFVIGMMALLAMIFLVFGYALFGIDKLVAHKAKKQNN